MKDPLEWKIWGVGVHIKECSVGGGGGGGGYGYFLEAHISNPTENNISVLCPKIMGNHQ